MSTQDQIRRQLAAAVDGVAGISCTSHYRQSLRPSDAFVRFGGRMRDGSGLGYDDAWQIWVALHQDVATAERWLNDHIDRVMEALSPVLNVNSVTPAQLAPSTGGATVAGVIFEGIREAG